MKTLIRFVTLIAATAAIASAQVPSITLQDEIELYNAIVGLDRGTTKIIDGKPQGVPFTFSAATRFTLTINAGLVKSRAEAYQTAASSVAGRIDPKGTNDNDKRAAITAELLPIFQKPDANPPAFQKIPLADLNLDANPIPIEVLTKLKVIIQQ